MAAVAHTGLWFVSALGLVTAQTRYPVSHRRFLVGCVTAGASAVLGVPVQAGQAARRVARLAPGRLRDARRSVRPVARGASVSYLAVIALRLVPVTLPTGLDDRSTVALVTPTARAVTSRRRTLLASVAHAARYSRYRRLMSRAQMTPGTTSVALGPAGPLALERMALTTHALTALPEAMGLVTRLAGELLAVPAVVGDRLLVTGLRRTGRRRRLGMNRVTAEAPASGLRGCARVVGGRAVEMARDALDARSGDRDIVGRMAGLAARVLFRSAQAGAGMAALAGARRPLLEPVGGVAGDTLLMSRRLGRRGRYARTAGLLAGRVTIGAALVGSQLGVVGAVAIEAQDGARDALGVGRARALVARASGLLVTRHARPRLQRGLAVDPVAAQASLLAVLHDGALEALSARVTARAVFWPYGVVLAERVAGQAVGAGPGQHRVVDDDPHLGVAARAQVGAGDVKAPGTGVGDGVARAAFEADVLDVDEMPRALPDGLKSGLDAQARAMRLAGQMELHERLDADADERRDEHRARDQQAASMARETHGLRPGDWPPSGAFGRD